MVAISNTPTTEQIHSIIDRHQAAVAASQGCDMGGDIGPVRGGVVKHDGADARG